MLSTMVGVGNATGAAMRRRERRLRAWALHERLWIAMALATVEHHSYWPTANAAPRGQTTGTSAREGEVREQHYGLRYGLRAQKRPLPGMRPAPLLEVLPQVGLQRHTVEQRIEHSPYVQILDAPVPLKVEQLDDFFKDLDIEGPAQVIEVPKISQDIIPQRSVDLVPQMVEQLVEVPTILTPTRIALRIAEQIVDIPASARGVSGSLQGFPPEQSSAQRTASQIADILVPGRGVFGSPQGSLSEQSTAKRTASQIADIPVPGLGGSGCQRITALHVAQERISERIEQFDAGGDFPSRRAGPRVGSPETGFNSCWCQAARRQCFFWRSSRFSPRTGFNGVSWTCSR